ncbi:MAG: tetratricopeptide repeat protein [Campylobacterales bacterium]|nr:tetratricopeptide repeat protein [Campylobacterales bacterium]
MLQWILFLLFSFNLFALEISIDSAKDEFQKYSTLYLKDSKPFVCQEIKNEFETVTEILCAFPKRPSEHLKTITNDFFIVQSILKDDTFFLSIKPLAKIKLLGEIFNLTKDDSVYDVHIDISKEWIVLGYKEDIPLIYKDKHPEIGINFPFYMDKDKLPYVGSLDIKGNPVHIKRVGDVKEYIKIKSYYEKKQYERALDAIEEVLREYPNTLFKAELIYYKIKVYSKLKDYDNVVSESKVYLRDYSANENIPEVLALVSHAYANIGMITDAEYFFDRLFSEHENSIFTKWGYIYMGEMLESSGGASKASTYYLKALNETKSVDVASSAAYHLANLNLGMNSKESEKYIEKIVAVKPDYFKEHLTSSNRMMNALADEERFKSAALIAGAILDEIDPTYDEYEMYLRDKALWLSKSNEKQEALQALNRYIKEFPDGDSIHEVELAKDALFFDALDVNTTARLAEYDKLIEEYPHDTIGNRAIYERAKLWLELDEFSKIITNKEQLLELDAEVYPQKEDIVTQGAIGLMEASLKNKACHEVIVIANDYNITLSNSWDDGIYECAMKGGDFQLAKKMATKNVKSPNIELRKKWLYRYVQVDFAIGNYSDSIAASKDLITLIGDETSSQYNDVYRYLFDAYNRVEETDKLLGVIEKIEILFGEDYKDIERYITMMSVGSQNHDDNMVIKYGTKVMDIQKKSTSYAQSPYVEFTLYQSYINQENYNLALYVIESLNDVQLQKVDRGRQKYLLGSVLAKLWRDDEAKIAYKEAIEADADSPWASLAKSALNL